jgi:hypothetical protein
MFFTEFIRGKWSTPDTAVFSKKLNNHEPFFSRDGHKSNKFDFSFFCAKFDKR